MDITLTSVDQNDDRRYLIADHELLDDPVSVLDEIADVVCYCGRRSGHRCDHGSDHAGARDDHVIYRVCVRIYHDRYHAVHDIAGRKQMRSPAAAKRP